MSKNIEQRTPEWFKQRKGKITGSVAGAALGLNPYMTPMQLIRRMVREYHGLESEFTGNIATEYGPRLAMAATPGKYVLEVLPSFALLFSRYFVALAVLLFVYRGRPKAALLPPQSPPTSRPGAAGHDPSFSNRLQEQARAANSA